MSYVYEDLSSKQIHAHFVDLMHGDLKKIVEDKDVEIGVMELIETMKKQHVMNFAMHHELVNAVQIKQSIEEWRAEQIKKTKTSANPLSRDVEEIVTDLKQIWRTFNELIQAGKLKMVHKGEESIHAKT